MTDAEAIKWLTRRSAVLIMHEDRIVAVVPDEFMEIRATNNDGVKIQIPARAPGGGFVLGLSDPGDSLADVVACVQAAWRRRCNAVDAIADAHETYRHKPVVLDFETDIEDFQPS